MSAQRTPIAHAAAVSRVVHLVMGLLAEIVLPLVVGVLAGYAVSFVSNGEHIPVAVTSAASVSTAVLLTAVAHALICNVITSAAPCALSVVGRLMFPFRSLREDSNG